METNPPKVPIYDILTAFESKSYSSDILKSQHRSLYYFLLGMWIKKGCKPTIQMAATFGMEGSKIGSSHTYQQCIEDLEKEGLIKHTKGVNRFSSAKIELLFCKSTATQLQAYSIATYNSTDVSTADNIKHNTNKPKSIILKPFFDEFWEKYQKKSGKQATEKLWHKLTDEEIQLILNHVPKYVLSTPDPKYRKDPESYLRNKRWQDEIIPTLTEEEKDRIKFKKIIV